MKANEDGDELVYTKRAEASDSGSWGSGEGDFLTNPAAEMSLNTSVDPEKVAPGEYIVHKKYGVGQFLGMKQMPQENGPDIMYMFLKVRTSRSRSKSCAYACFGVFVLCHVGCAHSPSSSESACG